MSFCRQFFCLYPVRLAWVALLWIGCQASPTGTSVSASDFQIQGEYAGTLEASGKTLGAQVVAKGQGAFTAVLLPGGLPGAGWNESERIEQNGSLRGDSVQFPAQGPTAYSVALVAEGPWLKGQTPQGEPFRLDQVSRESPTLGAPPPSNATVLFDGKDLSSFVSGSAVMDSGLLLPQGTTASGATTLRSFGSFRLHLEFRIPFQPDRSGQARGNSGIYLQGRYELQILDSFGLDFFRGDAATATRECGAFFELASPRLNMSLPPLRWQTYDVDFSAARFDAEGKTPMQPASVTVRLNGIVIHENRELSRNTLLGDAVTSAPGPLRFQAHGDPVKFRNIWIVETETLGIPPSPRQQRRGLGQTRWKSPAIATTGITAGGRALPNLLARQPVFPNPRLPGFPGEFLPQPRR